MVNSNVFLCVLCNVGDGLHGKIDGKNFIDDPLSCDPYYLKATLNKKMINEFDLNRKSIFWSQVEDNASGKLNNTWDIFGIALFSSIVAYV